LGLNSLIVTVGSWMVVLRPQINRYLSFFTQLFEQNEKKYEKKFHSCPKSSTLSSIYDVLAPNVALVDGIL
jgi:hypothetical protein